jgi:outer membrane lipoprotein-sorting protein
MSPKKALPAIALAALLVLAGCSGFAGQELGDQRSEDLVDRMEQRIEDISTIEATISFAAEYGNQSMSSATELKANFDTGEYWSETLEPSERAGDVTVYNGSAMTTYDESENTVHVYEASFSMNGESNLSESLDTLVEKTDIVYNGTEQIGDRETAKFTLAPANGTDAMYESVTLWADTDRMIPVRVQMETAGESTTTITLSDVELNPEFSEGTFEFEPPADATYEKSSGMDVESETYESREDLAAAVDREVPPAELPGDFRFEEALTFGSSENESIESIHLEYADGEQSVSVMLSEASENMRVEYEDAEEVTIDGQTAQYHSVGDTGNVVWECDGTRYVVFGNVEQSTLTTLASGIGC